MSATEAAAFDFDRLLPKSGIALALGVGETTIWRRMRDDPAFPRPLRIGARLYWKSDEIADYVRQQKRGVFSEPAALREGRVRHLARKTAGEVV